MSRHVARPKPRHPNVEAALSAANDAKPAICPCGRNKPATRTGRCRSCASELAMKTRKAQALNPPPVHGTWRHPLKEHDQLEEWDCGVCSAGGHPVFHEPDDTVCMEGPTPVYRPVLCDKHPNTKALSTGRCVACAHALAYANREPKDGEQLQLGAGVARATETSPLMAVIQPNGEITPQLLEEHSYSFDGQARVIVLVEGAEDGVLLARHEGPGGYFAGYRIPAGWTALARVPGEPMEERPLVILRPPEQCACGLPSVHHRIGQTDFLQVPGLGAELSAIWFCRARRFPQQDPADQHAAALEAAKRMQRQVFPDEELGFTEVPSRYANGGSEVIDEIRRGAVRDVQGLRRLLGRGFDAVLQDDKALGDLIFAVGFCGGSTVKYSLRQGAKGRQDAEKRDFYVQMENHVMLGAADPREGRDGFAPFSHTIDSLADGRVVRWTLAGGETPLCPVTNGDTHCPGTLSRIVGEDQAEALGAVGDGSQAVCVSCGTLVLVESLPVHDRALLGPISGFAGGDEGGVLVAPDELDEDADLDDLFIERLDRLVHDPIARAALEARFGRTG